METALHLIPSGWIRRNQMLCADVFQQSSTVFDLETGRFSPQKNLRVQAAISTVFATKRPHNFLASSVVPNFTKAALTVAAR